MKKIVLYHENCQDGFAAAYVCWTKFGDDACYIPVNYFGQVVPDPAEYLTDILKSLNIPKEKTVPLSAVELYIVDFSYPINFWEYFKTVFKYCYMFNHHKTAFEEYFSERIKKDLPYNDTIEEVGLSFKIVLSSTSSGSLITYSELFPDNAAPMWLQFVSDRDLWNFNLDSSKAFHAGMESIKPWTFNKWKSIVAPDNNSRESISSIVSLGRKLLEIKQAKIVEILDTKVSKCCFNIYRHDSNDNLIFPTCFLGYACNVEKALASDIGAAIAEKYNPDYVLLYHVNNLGEVKCDLRNLKTNPFDTRIIASFFGGGGHEHSSGFTTDLKTLAEVIRPL